MGPRGDQPRNRGPRSRSRLLCERLGVSHERENVFADDGRVSQVGTMSGSVADGLVVELAVPVEA
jgi:hypothetical protein